VHATVVSNSGPGRWADPGNMGLHRKKGGLLTWTLCFAVSTDWLLHRYARGRTLHQKNKEDPDKTNPILIDRERKTDGG
jgi:hypothetical protein